MGMLVSSDEVSMEVFSTDERRRAEALVLARWLWDCTIEEAIEVARYIRIGKWQERE